MFYKFYVHIYFFHAAKRLAVQMFLQHLVLLCIQDTILLTLSIESFCKRHLGYKHMLYLKLKCQVPEWWRQLWTISCREQWMIKQLYQSQHFLLWIPHFVTERTEAFKERNRHPYLSTQLETKPICRFE